MKAEQVLTEISEFCRAAGMAESTFGRAAINDGKLVSRLRNGGRITTDTLDKIRAYMADFRARNGLRAPVADARAPAPLALRPSGAIASNDARPSAQRRNGLPFLRQPAEVPALRQHLQ